MDALIDEEDLVEDISKLDMEASRHYRAGEYEEAIELLRKVYQYRVGILGADHEDCLLNLNNLGAALGRIGLLKEAEDAFRDSLRGRKKLKGLDHGNNTISKTPAPHTCHTP